MTRFDLWGCQFSIHNRKNCHSLFCSFSLDTSYLHSGQHQAHFMAIHKHNFIISLFHKNISLFHKQSMARQLTHLSLYNTIAKGLFFFQQDPCTSNTTRQAEIQHTKFLLSLHFHARKGCTCWTSAYHCVRNGKTAHVNLETQSPSIWFCKLSVKGKCSPTS